MDVHNLRKIWLFITYEFKNSGTREQDNIPVTCLSEYMIKEYILLVLVKRWL